LVAVQSEPPKPALRASDADREATAERLRLAAMEGRLDSDELEARMEAAYGARWCHQLETLTLDVTPPPPPPAPIVRPTFVKPAKRTNGLAIASVVSAVVWMWWLGSLAAVIMGHVALRQINRSGGRQTGRGVAITGLALGYLGLLTLAFVMFGATLG
jgi:Domain of unknown function (DUF4190)/Domain of unknown function (DUF1707)